MAIWFFCCYYDDKEIYNGTGSHPHPDVLIFFWHIADEETTKQH
jgi:hypothetical protein